MPSKAWPQRPPILFFLSLFIAFVSSVLAFEVPLLDTDYSRQICSGMWGGPSAYINVTFDSTSQGELAMVIYEWADTRYLGKSQFSDTDDEMPKIYVCTGPSLSQGYCTKEQLGHFILDLPAGKTANETSFWSALVELPNNKAPSTALSALSTTGLWDNPGEKPHPPKSEYDSPFRRAFLPQLLSRQATPAPVSDPLIYNGSIHYPVTKTGFYCVAAIPVTMDGSSSARAETNISYHPSYKGKVLFQNVFKGQLPATDYPKVTFYFLMFVVYAGVGAVWGWFCYRHLHDLLPIQYYLSGLVGLLVIEMLANWVYYRFLNAHGKSTASTVFLIVVAILDAGRNSMSFFMLLVVSLGLSVVRESLGRTMLKCQALAGAHFLFGILYSIGIVELELESTSALVLLIFIIPLAFTLSGFLLWIMYSLNATIAQLRARKQRYKLTMFERLYWILLSAVVVIAIFFVVSSMSFSGRLAEDYAAKSWKTRWWLLDGWLALLYLAAFVLIIFLWRPSENNARYVFLLFPFVDVLSYLCFFSTLMLSEELAQDEEDAEDYDLEALQHRTRVPDEDDEDDAATLVGGRRGHPETVHGDDVVFEIGDEDEDEEDSKKRKAANRLSGENHRGAEGERLMQS